MSPRLVSTGRRRHSSYLGTSYVTNARTPVFLPGLGQRRRGRHSSRQRDFLRRAEGVCAADPEFGTATGRPRSDRALGVFAFGDDARREDWPVAVVQRRDQADQRQRKTVGRDRPGTPGQRQGEAGVDTTTARCRRTAAVGRVCRPEGSGRRPPRSARRAPPSRRGPGTDRTPLRVPGGLLGGGVHLLGQRVGGDSPVQSGGSSRGRTSEPEDAARPGRWRRAAAAAQALSLRMSVTSSWATWIQYSCGSLTTTQISGRDQPPAEGEAAASTSASARLVGDEEVLEGVGEDQQQRTGSG